MSALLDYVSLAFSIASFVVFLRLYRESPRFFLLFVASLFLLLAEFSWVLERFVLEIGLEKLFISPDDVFYSVYAFSLYAFAFKELKGKGSSYTIQLLVTASSLLIAFSILLGSISRGEEGSLLYAYYLSVELASSALFLVLLSKVQGGEVKAFYFLFLSLLSMFFSDITYIPEKLHVGFMVADVSDIFWVLSVLFFFLSSFSFSGFVRYVLKFKTSSFAYVFLLLFSCVVFIAVAFLDIRGGAAKTSFLLLLLFTFTALLVLALLVEREGWFGKEEGLLEFIPDSAMVVDEKRKILRVNSRLKELKGVDRAEGDYCYRVFWSRESPCPDCPIGGLRKRKVYEKDSRFYEVRVFPLDYKGKKSFLLVGRDITDIRVSEGKLRQLERALEHAEEGVFVADAGMSVVYANKKARDFIGREVEGAEVWEVARLFGLPLNELKRRIYMGRSFSHETVKDGRVFKVSVFPVASGGSVYGCAVIVRDVTEEKEVYEQLLQAQKLESLGRLVGGVIHDFNNHLLVINGYAELLMERLEGRERGYVEKIVKAVNAASQLARRLLLFARKEKGEPVVLDLGDFVESMGDVLRTLLGERYVLKMDLSKGIKVKVDRSHLEQVLFNLVTNARDAMPDGGEVSIKVWKRSVRGRDFAVLSVQDTGVGMDEETKERIFEPFFTTKPPGKGTGLGLSIVYGIVTQAGGFIEVESEKGKGSVFHIHLPLVEGEEFRGEEEEGELLVGSGKVLIVEDDEAVREVLRGMLERLGFEVDCASCGRDALELASSNDYRVVLCDYVLPDMDGKKVIKELKKLRPGVKAAVVSGYADRIGEDVVTLQKPFTLKDLSEAVRRLLDSG